MSWSLLETSGETTCWELCAGNATERETQKPNALLMCIYPHILWEAAKIECNGGLNSWLMPESLLK